MNVAAYIEKDLILDVKCECCGKKRSEFLLVITQDGNGTIILSHTCHACLRDLQEDKENVGFQFAVFKKCVV